ncbi:hypothetical protein N2152v2_005519 [Parachlorella kessleri]
MSAAEGRVSPSGASSEEGSRADPGKLKWHRKFAYQKFKGWRPILNVASAQIFFIAAGLFCIGLGIPILTASLTVHEYTVRYEDQGPFAALDSDAQQELLWRNADAGVPIDVAVQIDSNLDPPIYVFYRLGSFFQNYRRYVRSIDSNAMHDGSSGAGSSACDPFRYVGDEANPALTYDGAIFPCGQIANSNFNDSFTMTLTPEGGSEVPLELDESNLAWPSDQEHLYGDVTAFNYNTDPNLRGGNTTTLPLDQSQHWMVWMKPGGGPAVYKMYAQINTQIPAGSTVRIRVANRYNTYDFGGSKSIILTTNSWVGGRNNFLGALWITIGGLSLLVALAFFLAYNAGLVQKRQYGDLSELSWLKKYDGSIRPAQQQRVSAQPVQDSQVAGSSRHPKN